MTGEIEKGRSISVSSRFLPLNSNLAMAQEAARPTTALNGTAMAATSRVSRMAASVSGSPKFSNSVPQPLRNASMKTVMSGKNRIAKRNSTAMAISTALVKAVSLVARSGV